MSITEALLVGASIGTGLTLFLEHFVFPAIFRVVLIQSRTQPRR